MLDKYGVKPSPIIRKTLEDEVKRLIPSELEEKAKELSRRVSHISDDEVAETLC